MRLFRGKNDEKLKKSVRRIAVPGLIAGAVCGVLAGFSKYGDLSFGLAAGCMGAAGACVVSGMMSIFEATAENLWIIENAVKRNPFAIPPAVSARIRAARSSSAQPDDSHPAENMQSAGLKDSGPRKDSGAF